MRKKSSYFLTLIIGIAIGIFGGILFAPTRGSHIRRSISYQFKRLGERIQLLVTRLVRAKHKSMATSLAKVAGQDLVEKTVQKAQKLLEEVRLLSAQLESNQDFE